MTIQRQFKLIMLLSAWSLCAAIQPLMAESGEAQTKEAISGLIEEMWQALGDKDESAFKAYCKDEWFLVTGMGSRITAAQMFAFHRANMSDFRLIPSGMDITVFGDVAWAHYDARMEALRQGEAWSADFAMTNLFIRDSDGEWRCVLMHETRLPAADPN